MAALPRTKRVRLREDHGNAIVFRHPDETEDYLKALFAQLPLETHHFERIADFAKHRVNLAKALVTITDAEPPEAVLRALQAIPNARAKLLNYVMQCYFVAHRRAALLTGDGIVEAARHTWSLLMHVYLDAARRETTEAQAQTQKIFDQPADTLPFCMVAMLRGEPICVSSEPVRLFSVRTHWQALSTAATSLYAFPYSTNMYYYIRALTLRHAQLLCGQVEDAHDSAALADVYDHPLYCAPDVGRPFLRGGPLKGVLLNDRYLGDTETLLGSQLVRLTRVRWLLEAASQKAPEPRPQLDLKTTPKPWFDAIRAFVDDIAIHEKLRRFVVDRVREQLVGTLLMHGETARFARAHPRQDPVPDNVLATMRHNAYKTVAELSMKPVAEFVRETLTAMAASEDADPQDWTARVRATHEPSALLVLAVVTDVWMQYRGTSKDFVMERLFWEELRVGKDELAPVFEVPEARPCFLRCMRWNFVVDAKGVFTYAGTGFVAAYAAWLRVLFTTHPDNGRGAKLGDEAIHDAWKPLLQTAVSSAAGNSVPPSKAANPGVAFFS